MRKTAIERFNEKWEVDADGCHIWTACLSSSGYGSFRNGDVVEKAHRWIFQHTHGWLPEAVMHHCDKPRCVRISCLMPGTQIENIADRCKKGRTSRASRNLGVRNAACRLTDEEVHKIRTGYATGLVSHAMLGELYGLSAAHVGDLINGKYRAREGHPHEP